MKESRQSGFLARPIHSKATDDRHNLTSDDVSGAKK